MKDYRGQTGVIGSWKGYDVFVLTKEDYMEITPRDNTVYVISDDKCQMVSRGNVVGILEMGTGTVVEMSRTPYKPVRRVEAPQKEEVSSTYEQYASVVNEFFKHLQDPVIVSD